MLKGKHIVLGITGSIAAYKAAVLVRLLVSEGAEVRVIMTSMAKEFITPLTMATLSKHPILVDFYNPENGDWNSHVSLGIWADLLLIAPASANTIAKMTTGIADNLLLTSYLSARCPVMVAPAMDMDMFLHSATQQNIEKLASIGVHFVDPAEGELASGLTGKGRMAEPNEIIREIKTFFSRTQTLAANHFLVTAGPTFENIDSVRFIGNYSTGKMGYAIAEALARRGAKVTLVSGPTALHATHSAITTIPVTSASEMYDVSTRIFPETSGAVLCAAVSDFTPEQPYAGKIKREKDTLQIKLKPTEDIAATLGKVKKPPQKLVGFALETEQGEVHAKQKLEKKNLDIIVLNSLNDEGAGFGVDTNKVSIINRKGEIQVFPVKKKIDVAEDIVDAIEQLKT